MSKIVLYPANGFDFDAADVAAYLAGLTSGVFSSAEDFPVTAAGGLKVTVGAGRGWVHPSRFTGYSITKREADTLTMPLADPSLPRIDRIVMLLADTQNIREVIMFPMNQRAEDLLRLGQVSRLNALGELAAARAGTATAPAADPFTYFVQAGAFRTQEDADGQRARLSLMGVEARVTEREQAGRTVYRVRVGPFQNKDAADRVKDRLDGNGFDSALVRVQR